MACKRFFPSPLTYSVDTENAFLRCACVQKVGSRRWGDALKRDITCRARIAHALFGDHFLPYSAEAGIGGAALTSTRTACQHQLAQRLGTSHRLRHLWSQTARAVAFTLGTDRPAGHACGVTRAARTSARCPPPRMGNGVPASPSNEEEPAIVRRTRSRDMQQFRGLTVHAGPSTEASFTARQVATSDSAPRARPT